MDIGATVILAVPKDTIINILKRCQRDPFDNRRRNHRQNQQSKGDKEENREGRSGLEQHGDDENETCSIATKTRNEVGRCIQIIHFGKRSTRESSQTNTCLALVVIVQPWGESRPGRTATHRGVRFNKNAKREIKGETRRLVDAGNKQRKRVNERTLGQARVSRRVEEMKSKSKSKLEGTRAVR